MSMFHVGQRVVCIRQCGHKVPAGCRDAVVGIVYTIRRVAFAPSFSSGKNVLGLWMEEVINPINPNSGCEFGFVADRFRPVKDTSIEVFRKLLAPMPEVEDA